MERGGAAEAGGGGGGVLRDGREGFSCHKQPKPRPQPSRQKMLQPAGSSASKGGGVRERRDPLVVSTWSSLDH